MVQHDVPGRHVASVVGGVAVLLAEARIDKTTMFFRDKKMMSEGQKTKKAIRKADRTCFLKSN